MNRLLWATVAVSDSGIGLQHKCCRTWTSCDRSANAARTRQPSASSPPILPRRHPSHRHLHSHAVLLLFRRRAGGGGSSGGSGRWCCRTRKRHSAASRRLHHLHPTARENRRIARHRRGSERLNRSMHLQSTLFDGSYTSACCGRNSGRVFDWSNDTGSVWAVILYHWQQANGTLCPQSGGRRSKSRRRHISLRCPRM